VPTNLDDLKQLVTRTLGPAKENLIEYGQALPMVLLFSHDGRRRTIPAPDKFQVGKIIKNEKPDSFVYISEVWIRDDITPEEEQLKKTREGWEEISRRMQAGRMLAPGESPNRREAIMLVGGTGTLRVSLVQKFRRVHGKIVFDDLPEMAELKAGDSLVDWDDNVASNPSRLLTAAPVGGRIIPFKDFEIWIPEGWRMDWEPNDTDPDRKPVWYREKDPHGGLRIRLYNVIPTPDKPRNVLNDARAEAEKRKTLPDVKDVILDERRGFPILAWTQLVTGADAGRPWLAHMFKVLDAKGSILVAFQHRSDISQGELQAEVASAKEIANRIVRL